MGGILSHHFLLDDIAEAIIFGDGEGGVEEGVTDSAIPMDREANNFKESHGDDE